MHRKTAYGGLDSFRILAAFLVVAIHTSPLSAVSPEADFFLTRILARVAVPFFFLVTGQFVLGSSSTPSRPAAFSTIKKYLLKIAGLYGISILLYLPFGIYAGHYRGLHPLDFLRLLVFDGTFYHLWYFPACILGVLLVWLLMHKCSLRAVTAMAAVLYVIGLLGDSYYGLIAQVPVLSPIYDGLFGLFSYTRNGLFFAPLFLVMGLSMQKHCMQKPSRQNQRQRTRFLTVGLLVSLTLLTTEGFLLRHFALQRHDSMYLALVPTMYFLYRLLLLWKARPHPLTRTVSTWIYVLHPAMIVLVRGGAKFTGLTGLLVDNSLMHYLAVSLASMLSGICISLTLQALSRKPCSTGRAWVELDRAALAENVAALRAALPESCKLMPALKANAYGHGAVPLARELNRLGVKNFCVASVSEGVTLRRRGVRGSILILGYTSPKDFYLLRRYRLTQTVLDFAYAAQLNRYGRKLSVHIGIDTGMHRLGEPCGNLSELCRIYRMKRLAVKGLFTHLCASDGVTPEEKIFTEKQAKAFFQVINQLKKRGFSCPGLHLLASYGILNYPQYAADYARVGIALYGVFSTPAASSLPLRPVLSLKARVAAIKELYAGESAGYGLAFTADRPTKLAVLSIGYADGLPRALSCGKGEVLINGRRAPIVGRICMDQTLVDVTDISCPSPGAEAVLIGRFGTEEITAYDLARECGTITNEVLSRLGERLTRVFS